MSAGSSLNGSRCRKIEQPLWAFGMFLTCVSKPLVLKEIGCANRMENRQKGDLSAAPVIRSKIPISLSVVSYIFLAGGLLNSIAGFAGMVVARTDLPISPLISFILGISYLFLSRGLRRYSRGWHIYALIIIFYLLVTTVYGTAYYFFHYPFHGENAYIFLSGRIIAFSVEVWILRVLTRVDIRLLF